MEGNIKNINYSYSNPLFYCMLSIAIIGSLGALLLNIFRWSLADMLSPLFAPFLDIMVYSLFFISSLIVFIYYVASKKSNHRAKSGIPLLINSIVFVLILVIPFTSIGIDLDYRFNEGKREQVVQMVLEGSLKPNISGNGTLIKLPDEYSDLSKGGGEIIVERSGQHTQILFFTFRGMLDNFSGFIYTSDGSAPDSKLFGEFKQVEKFSNNWYWISAS